MFRTAKNTFIAIAAGAKAHTLKANAELHNLQVENTVSFGLQASKAARDGYETMRL